MKPHSVYHTAESHVSVRANARSSMSFSSSSASGRMSNFSWSYSNMPVLKHDGLWVCSNKVDNKPSAASYRHDCCCRPTSTTTWHVEQAKDPSHAPAMLCNVRCKFGAVTCEHWKPGAAMTQHMYLPNQYHCCELPQAVTALAEPGLFLLTHLSGRERSHRCCGHIDA